MARKDTARRRYDNWNLRDELTNAVLQFLRWYLTKLNSDPSKMEYWAYLNKVG